MARKQKDAGIDPEKVYICHEGFVGVGPDGEEVLVHYGTRLRGDDWRVSRWSLYFAEDGVAYTPLESPEWKPQGIALRKPLSVDSPGALRVKRDYIGMIGYGGGKGMFEFRAGDLAQENWPEVGLIRKTDPKLYESLFEKAK